MNLLLLLPAVGLAFFLGLRVNPAPIRSGPLSPLHNAIWNDGSLIFTLLGGTFVLIMALRVPLFRWFDQTYFGDVNSTQQTLTQTGRALPRLMDTWQIGQELLNGIEATLHPVNALFVVEEESGPRCLAARCLTGFVPPRDLPPGLVSAAPLQISAVPSLDNRYGLQQAAWLREMPARAAALLYEAEIRLYGYLVRIHILISYFGQTFNRTRLELKSSLSLRDWPGQTAFNRTRLELKDSYVLHTTLLRLNLQRVKFRVEVYRPQPVIEVDGDRPPLLECPAQLEHLSGGGEAGRVIRVLALVGDLTLQGSGFDRIGLQRFGSSGGGAV